MRAVHATAIGGPEVLRAVNVDTPSPGRGEALLRIRVAGINAVDVMRRADLWRHVGDPAPHHPFVPGVEGVGTVHAVAEDVREIAVGARAGIVMHDARTYAEYTAVPAERLIPIPDDVDDVSAASLLVAGLLAHVMLTEFVDVGAGTDVLVTGVTGSTGSVAAQWAAALGARVIAVVSSTGKVEAARRLGAAAVVDLSTQDLVGEVRRLTVGRGVRLALDAAGGGVFRAAFEALGARGVLVPYGIAAGRQPPLEVLSLVDRSRTIAGLMLFDFLATRSALLDRASAVFDAIRRGDVRADAPRIFALDDAAAAHRDFEDPARRGKILLRPSPPVATD